MLKSYAARYSLIALALSILFAIVDAVVKLIEAGVPITLSAFFITAGPEYWLMLTFTALAYVAGLQRDRAAALARERDALNDIWRTLMPMPDTDLEQSLPRALQQIAVVANAEAAALLTLDHAQWLLRAVTAQTALDWLQLPHDLPWPSDGAQRIVTRVATLSESEAAMPPSQRSVVCVAVYSEEQPAGWLVLLTPQAYAARRGSGELLITIADQFGAALARARQYTLMRRRARDMEAIAQTNRLLLAGMGLDELLDIIVNSAQVRFGLPYVTVMWIDEAAGDFYLRAQAGPLTVLAMPNFRQKLTDGLAGRVLRTGQPYLARDAQHEPDYIPAVTAAIRSLLLTPLKTAERVIGVMTFESLTPDAFSAEECC
jgi:GAF domain-containing protein